MSKIVISSNCVFTGLKDEPEEAAILIEGNKIMKITGTIEEMEPWITSDTEIKNFEDKLVIPGFHDFHLHIFPGALELISVNLTGTKSEQEVIDQLKESVRIFENKQWIIGFSWENGCWENTNLPTKQSLDEIFPDRPVILNHLENHYCWVNSKALEIAGINRNTSDPDFGQVVKDENGEPTGILMEKAQDLVQQYAYSFTEEEKLTMLRNYFDHTAAQGITSMNDMYAPSSDFLDDFSLYSKLDEKGYLKSRIYLQPKLNGDIESAIKLRNEFKYTKIRMNGLKQFVDGVITGHTAFLLEAYADRNQYMGETTYPVETLEKWILEADREGFSIRLHAIGDGAVKFSLDAFEKARKLNGPKDVRHTIEHVECIQEEDIARFEKLNIIASVQPYHLAALESKIYMERLGLDRYSRTFLNKSFIEAGTRLALGSDFPVVKISPMHEIYHAVTRKDSTNVSTWNENEKLSMPQAIRSYTIEPAYGSFREHETGTLEEGKLADLVVLDRNLFTISHEDILETKILLTVMDGEIMYASNTKSKEEQVHAPHLLL
ncbi:hypothetical protein ASG99_26460 [Bacillus sp. Soil768D1]|nr:hypothetical protein ASG99_26460 [Bacillus sp. Soil768D1]